MNILASLLNWSKADAPAPDKDYDNPDLYETVQTVLTQVKYSGRHATHGIVHVLHKFTVLGTDYVVVVNDDEDDYRTYLIQASHVQPLPENVYYGNQK